MYRTFLIWQLGGFILNKVIASTICIVEAFVAILGRSIKLRVVFSVTLQNIMSTQMYHSYGMFYRCHKFSVVVILFRIFDVCKMSLIY